MCSCTAQNWRKHHCSDGGRRSRRHCERTMCRGLFTLYSTSPASIKVESHDKRLTNGVYIKKTAMLKWFAELKIRKCHYACRIVSYLEFVSQASSRAQPRCCVCPNSRCKHCLPLVVRRSVCALGDPLAGTEILLPHLCRAIVLDLLVSNLHVSDRPWALFIIHLSTSLILSISPGPAMCIYGVLRTWKRPWVVS